MKKSRIVLSICVAGALGCAVGLGYMNRLLQQEHARLANEQAAWQAERVELEGALERARRSAVPAIVTPSPAQPAATAQPTPAEIIARLQGLSGPSQVREAVYWLEVLVKAGHSALAEIRTFLERNEDIEFDSAWAQSKAARDGKLPGDFILPPSLRLGLLDVVRRIGGPEAEKLLANTLSATGRGLEVAYITRLLHEAGPNRYRDAAVGAAQRLLAAGPISSTSPLDRYHRDYLFGVLAFYDASYVASAQSQMISPEGKADRSTLRYLQQNLGAQMVPIAAQAYADPRLTESSAKESFARVALAYVGADQRANEFWQQSINDFSLAKDDRRQLIEDLNQEGFVNRKNLTANDLPLVQNRIALIEQLAPNAQDPVNIKAFNEAYKDLTKMRDRIINPPPPQPAAGKP